MAVRTPDITGGDGGLQKGEADGMVPIYNSTTAVALISGQYEANGKDYELTAAATLHTVTTLASAFNRHYIYIDDSASTPPVPTFIDKTVAPVEDNTRHGWYDGDDRAVGFVYSPAGSAIILPYSIRGRGKLIRMHVNPLTTPEFTLALNLNPTGNWQATTLAAADATPVNAVELNLQMSARDSAFTVRIAATSIEFSVLEILLNGGDIFRISNDDITGQGWVILGASRNVVIGGEADDDNVLRAVVNGVGYSR